MKDVYRRDFDAADFVRGYGHGDCIVASPVLPSEFNSRLIGPDGSIEPGVVLSAESDKPPAALLWRVVAMSESAAIELAPLACGDVMILRNLAGYTVSARMKFLLVEPRDVLWSWREGEL